MSCANVAEEEGGEVRMGLSSSRGAHSSTLPSSSSSGGLRIVLLGEVSVEEQLMTERRGESLGTKFNSKVSSTDDTCYLYTREPR